VGEQPEQKAYSIVDSRSVSIMSSLVSKLSFPSELCGLHELMRIGAS